MSPLELLDRLVAKELQADLSGVVIGREIIVLGETSSTNDAILQMAKGNPKEGLVVFAEHQIAGRGQRGNRWESAAGKGLCFSILLRPKIDINRSPRLTAWAAKAVADTIQNELSLKTTIKLPNDVQIDGRKVAGVLVEMRAREKALQDFAKELRGQAISLAMALNRQVDRQKFAVAVLRNLGRTYREAFGS